MSISTTFADFKSNSNGSSPSCVALQQLQSTLPAWTANGIPWVCTPSGYLVSNLSTPLFFLFCRLLQHTMSCFESVEQIFIVALHTVFFKCKARPAVIARPVALREVSTVLTRQEHSEKLSLEILPGPIKHVTRRLWQSSRNTGAKAVVWQCFRITSKLALLLFLLLLLLFMPWLFLLLFSFSWFVKRYQLRVPHFLDYRALMRT